MTARREVQALAILMLTGALLAGCQAGKSADAAETLAPVVVGPENISVAAKTTLLDGPSISGTLGAEREARVRAELGGSVLEVFAEPGQAVKAGQVLAQLEPQTAR